MLSTVRPAITGTTITSSLKTGYDYQKRLRIRGLKALAASQMHESNMGTQSEICDSCAGRCRTTDKFPLASLDPLSAGLRATLAAFATEVQMMKTSAGRVKKSYSKL